MVKFNLVVLEKIPGVFEGFTRVSKERMGGR